MLKIEEKSAIEQLRRMSVHLGADFHEGIGAARLELDNENGKGYIFTYDVLPGFAVRTYNVKLKNDLEFEMSGRYNDPIYLLYCLHGHYFHRFRNQEEDAERISRGQNVILSATEDNPNMVIIPSGIEFKVSVLIITQKKIDGDSKFKERLNLSKVLDDVLAKMEDDRPHRYFGGITNDIEKYAKVLIENKRTDAVGKLLTEGAALNTLASQLDQHDKNHNGKWNSGSLSKDELERIVVISDKISKNLDQAYTVEQISRETGIAPKKLQEGFRFLFGESVAVFVKNLKLERARELIQTTDLNVSEVVHDIGIQSKSYFSKIFREKFGMVPRDYQDSFLRADQTFELSYRSKAAFFIGEAEIKDIVDTSDINNKDSGITGCLIQYDGEFFQLLEGPKQQVLRLYEKIKGDSRHTDVELLWKGARKNRIFDEWGLILVSDRLKERNSASRDLGVDMKTMLVSGKKSTATTAMFWQQIRNRLRTAKKVAS
ncbi:MAG: BLUF domain-containing protein [Pricia sp.]